MAATNSRLINLSSRVSVDPVNTAIAGFVIANGPRRVLIRAVGPTLAQFTVSNPLQNLRLDLYSGSTVINTNNAWSLNGNTQDIIAAMSTVGAFSLPQGSGDAAILVNLQPGPYTAIVSSTNRKQGVVLLELYEVPERL